MILQGKRILVVEDEPIIAFALEDMLIEDGADVIAVGSLQDGLANARDERFDFAILDINLGDESGLDIARKLVEKGVPFIFTTGYGEDTLAADGYPDAPVASKPYNAESIAEALSKL